MTYVAMSLSDPASGYTSVIQPRDGVSAMSLDVQPAVRVVAEDRVSAHGSYDTTQFYSEGAITLTLRLWPGGNGQTAEQFLDEIGPLLIPSKRAVLVITNDQWAAPRQLTVRFDSRVAPVSDPTYTDAVISWKIPAGLWEAASPSVATVGAFIASSTGISIDPGPGGLTITTAGLVMPATSAPSPSQVTSSGTAPSQWTALLYGPCTGPALANDTTGQAVVFGPGLVLNAGDYVALDSQARTALLNGDPAGSVLGNLNFTATDWWLMQPGLNIIRFDPLTAGSGSQALLTWRSSWPA